MSTPSLYKNGAVFLIFPSRQAAKVLGRQHRQYILSVLMKIAVEVPPARLAAAAIQAADDLEL